MLFAAIFCLFCFFCILTLLAIAEENTPIAFVSFLEAVAFGLIGCVLL